MQCAYGAYTHSYAPKFLKDRDIDKRDTNPVVISYGLGGQRPQMQRSCIETGYDAQVGLDVKTV
jgi:hypothetical protein